jgi:hypothetical protein
MKNFECPSCCQPSFSFWKKMTLGPAKNIQCENCGALVSVPWIKSMIVILFVSFFPPVGAIVPFLLMPKQASLMAFVIALLVGALTGLFLLSWFYARWVPLVTKKMPNPAFKRDSPRSGRAP